MKLLFSLLFLFPFALISQTMTVNITLLTNEGGVHANMPVTLEDTLNKAQFKGKTDAHGKVTILVPVNTVYDVKIPDYTRRKLLNIPNAPGGTINSTMSYSAEMVENDKAFAMSEPEKADMDIFAKGLPDTTFYKYWNEAGTWSNDYYVQLLLELQDFNGQPLAGETVKVTGRKRKKSFKGITGPDGKLVLQLPKGDDYDLSFSYHKNFEFTQCPYSNGSSEVTWSFSYIGTKAYERMKKEEEERVKQVAIDQAAAQKAWEEEVRRSNMSPVELCKEEMLGYESGKEKFEDDAALTVLKRNPQWKNKLIVCDVTGSMTGFMQQLMIWFKNERAKDPGVQFVFFNDANPGTTVGQTKNWLYTATPVLDTLIASMLRWNDVGSGGEVAENDIESLIMATRLAKKPFDEIILIADNNSPVYDMNFLPQLVALNKPVHIILCGSESDFIEPDYLAIAWKTKGSVHTAQQDYFNLPDVRNGTEVKIGPNNFRLMNGEFIKL